MSDNTDAFFSQLPKGWGLVPLEGPHTEKQEPEPPDHKTLVSGIHAPFPVTKTPERPSDKRGYARLMIDARIEAKRRRHVRDPAQLAWDQEVDAKLMLKAAVGEHGNVAALIPVAKIMEQLHTTIAGRCGGFHRVSQNMAHNALATAARCFAKGDIGWTIKLMAPIHSLVVRRPGPEGMMEFLATFIRDLFPAAPQSYIPPQNRVGSMPARTNPTLADKQAQAKRKPKVQSAPDLEKVRQMTPERARFMLPAMMEALQDYEGEDRAQFEEAVAIMQQIGEQQ